MISISLSKVKAVVAVAVTAMFGAWVSAQTPQVATTEKARPVFVDGQAQIVPAFQDAAQWIRQTLWVETEFDSDGDGKRDRVFTDVTRPRQTDTAGLKVPVIGRDDFVRNKRSTGRPRDLADLAMLDEAAKGEQGE